MDINNTNSKKRFRDELEESEIDSPEAKRIRDDLLDILDDYDSVLDKNPATQELASVMKIFEEEISVSPAPESAEFFALSDSGDSQPDLGYLLEASDDELGLPPTTSSSSGEEEKYENEDLLRVTSDAVDGVGLGQIWGFDDEIPCYDPFGFGIGEDKVNNDNNNGEFLAMGGLFDHSDVLDGPSDFSDFSWRSESLPAL